MAASGGHWVKGSFIPAEPTPFGGPNVEVFEEDEGFRFLLAKRAATAGEINEMLPNPGSSAKHAALWDAEESRWLISEQPYPDMMHEDMSDYFQESFDEGYRLRQERFSWAFYTPAGSKLEVINWDVASVQAAAGYDPTRERAAKKMLERSTDRAWDNAFQGAEVAGGEYR